MKAAASVASPSSVDLVEESLIAELEDRIEQLEKDNEDLIMRGSQTCSMVVTYVRFTLQWINSPDLISVIVSSTTRHTKQDRGNQRSFPPYVVSCMNIKFIIIRNTHPLQLNVRLEGFYRILGTFTKFLQLNITKSIYIQPLYITPLNKAGICHLLRIFKVFNWLRM